MFWFGYIRTGGYKSVTNGCGDVTFIEAPYQQTADKKAAAIGIDISGHPCRCGDPHCGWGTQKWRPMATPMEVSIWDGEEIEKAESHDSNMQLIYLHPLVGPFVLGRPKQPVYEMPELKWNFG